MEDTPGHQATRLELANERRDRHDDLMEVANAIRADLRAHISEEKPILDEAKVMLATHGNPELVRARIEFINEWMEIAKERKALRRAVIEKSVVGIMWAVLVYLAFVIGHDIRDVIRSWTIK